MTEPGELLPEAVRSALLTEGSASAGDRLRAHAEALVRTRPSGARRWSEALLERSPGPRALRPWLEWSAATVRLLEGDLDGGEALLRTAARTFARSSRPELADRVRLSLIDVLGERLDLPRARRLALDLESRFASRGDGSRAAIALSNLACAEDAADRVDRAVRLWRRALRRFDGDADAFRVLLVSANLANAAGSAGRFEEAAEGHRRVVRQARKAGYDALELQAMCNLAETEFALGRVDDALSGWLEVIARADALGARLTAATARLELAAAELSLGRPDAAVERLVPALEAASALGLELERARAVRLLAVAEVARGGDADEARAAARTGLRGSRWRAQADLLEIDLALVGAEVPPRRLESAARRTLARGLSHRGVVGLAWAARRGLESGRRAVASRLAREVLAARAAGPWPRMTAAHVLALSVRDPAQGLRLARRAAREADRVHGRLVASADRTAFLRSRGEVYLDLVRRLVERDGPGDRRRCLELIHTLKSGWLLDELGRAATPTQDVAFARWSELRRSLAALLERAEGEEEPRVRTSGLWSGGELRRVENELVRLESELQRSRPALAPAWPGWRAGSLVRRLPAGHLFAEYLVAGDDLIVLVVARGRIRTARVAGAASEVARLVDSVRFHLDTHPWADASGRAARRTALEARLARLGRLLLEPLAGEPWQVLWIAPHDQLHHVPWAALITPAGQHLIDLGVVTLVPGGAAADAALAVPPTAPRRLALVAGTADRPPLVEAELTALAAGRPRATVARSASRATFLEALATADQVHLAGHAVFLDGVPGASGLRLEDGFVTVHDLASAEVSVRVVSFGVCSGLRIGSGDASRYEGFLRVLLGRGVRTVVGPTAWVEDRAAHDFGIAFHDALDVSGSPGEAYRAALDRLRAVDPHPAGWASFQLYGDVRPWRQA